MERCKATFRRHDYTSAHDPAPDYALGVLDADAALAALHVNDEGDHQYHHGDHGSNGDRGEAAAPSAGAGLIPQIEHTARHAADAGYRAVVASDGTSTVSDEWQEVALNYAMTNVATVASCAEIAEALTT